MTNHYEEAAAEVESRIKELEARLERTRGRDKTGRRVASIEAEIAKLKRLDLAKWRATGKWAQEIWG